MYCKVSDREEFVALIQQHAGGEPWARLPFARRLMRFGTTYKWIMEQDCNGWYGCWPEDEARYHRKAERIEAVAMQLCEAFQCKPIFQGDPRGATIKIAVPSGYTNDFGGKGICVPTS